MRYTLLPRTLLLAAFALRAASALAESKAAAVPQPAAACPADDRFASAGFRAFIDPQTGQLREPTPEEAQALSRAAREEFAQAIESLEAVVHPDGTISVDLKGLFMQNLVAVRNPDGTVSTRCVPKSESAALPTRPTPASSAPALEEK